MEGKIWGRNAKKSLHQTLLRETGGKSSLIRHIRCINYTEYSARYAKKQSPNRADEWFVLSEHHYRAKGLSKHYLWVLLQRDVFKSLEELGTESAKEIQSTRDFWFSVGLTEAKFQGINNKGRSKSVISSPILFLIAEEATDDVLLVLIKTSSCSILILSSFVLREALVFLSDCQASEQCLPLTVLQRLMKLYFHSQPRSIHLLGKHFLWVLHECALGTLTVISCCCQSSGTLITGLWVCCDLGVF